MKNRFAFGLTFGACLLGLMLGPEAAPALAAECFHYEPTPVTVIGKLFLREDFGPPNYGETPATDSRERHVYIALDQSICTLAGSDRPAYKEIKTMQIVSPSFPQRWIGKLVRIEGTLFTAETGHHQSDVLIQVKSIQPK